MNRTGTIAELTRQGMWPFEAGVAAGIVSGWEIITRVGRNAAIGAAYEDVWDYGGTRTDQAAAAAIHVSSSHADDTGTIKFWYIDADYARQSATVTLTGQTEKDTGVTGLMVDCAYNSGTADLSGDVYFYFDDTVTDGVPDTETKVLAKVPLAFQQTENAFFMIPTGFEGHLSSWGAMVADGVAAKSVGVELMYKESGGVYRTIDNLGVAGDGASSIQVQKNGGIVFAAKSIVKIRALAAADTDVGASFQLILRPTS